MKRLRVCEITALFLISASGLFLRGQTCRLQVAGVNRARTAYGPFEQECGVRGPFGNWGVASNYGPKVDGYQFQGWCKDDYVCYNDGNCGRRCNDEWFEWNTCTTDWRYSPPNCWLYNYNNCWDQQTDRPEGVHGSKAVLIGVNCPRDTNGDGSCDEGGCKDLSSYGEAINYASLYEIDDWGEDDFIETIYFPATSVFLTCEPGWCASAGSPWVSPSAYDPDPYNPKTYAEMAMVVDYGVYEDSVNCEYLRFGNPAYNCVW